MSSTSPRLLILGGSGRLGRALVRRVEGRQAVLTPSHGELDFQRPQELAQALQRLDFDAVVNTAGITSPDVCEDQPELAHLVNEEAPGIVAAECQRRGSRFVHISTDYVFAGDGTRPLSEQDPTAPVNHYGRTKLAGERAALAAMPGALVARVSWLFGPDKPSFPDQVLQQARVGQPVRAICDKWSTPTSTDDLAEWIEALITRHAEVKGVLHLCNSGIATWQEYAQATVDIAAELGLLPGHVEVAGHSMIGFAPFKAARPVFTPMSNALLTRVTGIVPDDWRVALRRSLQARLPSP